MVSSITQDPYSIIISLNLASSVNLNIGAPPRPTELDCVADLPCIVLCVRPTIYRYLHLCMVDSVQGSWLLYGKPSAPNDRPKRFGRI